jgi:hypothetical protein
MAVLDNIITGSFTSNGSSRILDIQCDLDYMEVLNYTQMATQQATGRGVKFEWYRGFTPDYAIEYKKTNSTDALNGVLVTSGGFTLVNTSNIVLGAPISSSGITNASPPVVTVGSTASLSTGDTVLVTQSTGALQIAGMQFTIQVLNGTTFSLRYMGAPGSVASAAIIQKVMYTPEFYPQNLFITNITQATSAVITLSVTHNLTIGQRVVFNIPTAFGMVELNGLRGQITAINTTNNTVTVNIDTSGFTAFSFPASGSIPFTFAQMIPFGDAPFTVANPQGNQSVLDGATRNQSVRGVLLAAGAQSPAGSDGDLIYWKALKASQVQS